MWLLRKKIRLQYFIFLEKQPHLERIIWVLYMEDYTLIDPKKTNPFMPTPEAMRPKVYLNLIEF